MDKLDMKSKDVIDYNIRKIQELFPNAVLEGKIDFEILKNELSDSTLDNKKEKYQLTWPGKNQSQMEVLSRSNNTLRLINKNLESKNIYIEGDNLDVLKILQESYLNKVKMIYIDPPYNTGNDFIYNDSFSTDSKEELLSSGQIDDIGNKLISNSSSSGRFHSNWLSMMYPRLKLARNLLRADGVIFISIDDNEVANLRKICDEIFGEHNLVSQIPWQSRASIQNDTDFSTNHEYILMYAKNRRQENRRLTEYNYNIWIKNDDFVCKPLELSKDKFSNPDNDPRGLWKADPFDAPNVRTNLTYEIENPNTHELFLPPNGRHWRMEQKKYFDMLNDNRILFGKDGKGRPQLKVFYEEKKDYGSIDNSWFSAERIGTSTNGTKELLKLFDGKSYFDTPKPTSLIKKLIDLANVKNDDIILDFFSGSATTADAILQMNSEDNGNRKFIMVQLPELCNEKSEAFKNGFKTICDIGEERIRRAAKKIQEDTRADIDYGFRVFKVDSTNMKDVYYKPSEVSQLNLLDYISNIKEDRTAEDLLTQVMLDLGLTLDLKIEEKKLYNNRVFFIENNSLVACFDDQVDINIVDEICKCNPMKVVFKDTSFKTDKDKINLEEKIKKLSPDTEVSVL